MPLFYHSYIFVPPSDRKKTTLAQGNPHRSDHFLLGATISQASLYQPPKSPQIEAIWLWDDDDFDPYDYQPSEYMVVKQLFDLINREMERVQQNQQVVFRQHYLVGTKLMHQLGFLHQRAFDYSVHSSENLYYAILGSSAIDLDLLATRRHSHPKSLKSKHLPSELSNFLGLSFHSPNEINEAYDEFAIDRIETYARANLQNLMTFYYELKNNQ